MSDEYKYSNIVSRFYDVVYDKILDKSGLKFYLDEISKAKGSVLEIGSGTGRIFVPALKSGADIYGLDLSENMTDELKKKIQPEDYGRIFLGNVTDFSLNRKFSLILAPFRIFSHLVSTDEQINALNRIHHHLTDDGIFIFDVFNPDFNLMTDDRREATDFVGEYKPGLYLKRHTIMEYDKPEQTINITFRFEYEEDSQIKNDECKFPMRYFFRFELLHLLNRCGFSISEFYGDFNKTGLNNNSKEFILKCMKFKNY